MALHDNLPIPPIVSLRRYGDIINLMPILRFLSMKQGAPVKLVVHRSFSPITQAVSYVEPVIWDGDMDDPMPAAKEYGGLNAQVHGKGLKPDRNGHNNFAKLAWRQLGYEWNRHVPLILDKRDEQREGRLARIVFTTDLPKVLVKLAGFSSPFPHGEKIWELLHREFDGLCELVDLNSVNAEVVYDLMGLIDRAACLVSIDTLTLWLARGSKCPVVALVNDTPFLASPPVGNVLARLSYSQAVPKWHQIASAIHSTLFVPDADEIVLVFNDFRPTNQNTQRRQDIAFLTWPHLGARLYPFPAQRTSRILGDHRGAPFIRDMINGAIATGREGIIAICNNDVKFDPGLRHAVIKSCREFGCYWAYRIESPGKPTDNGADFFAFTRGWWYQHQHFYPDLLLGYLWWDDLLVRMMRWSGCLERERLYYHEPHPGVITRPRTKGSDHNEILAHAWLGQHHELNQKPS